MKRKIMVMVLVFILVFAFATTALAGYWVDYATWSSSKCLSNFTTLDSVDKDSTETWDCITAWFGYMQFASTPQYDYMYITPKSSTGLTMGARTQYSDDNNGQGISITSNKNNNAIKLKIENPNSGNNMQSGGQWDGYVE